MITKLIWPIILQIMAVAVIIAEFILPSAGILAIISVLLFGYSLFVVFTTVSTSIGFIFVGVDLLLIPILVVIGIKLLVASPITLRSALISKKDGTSQPEEHKVLMGKEGITLTDLHPAGAARIEGKKWDVVSRGDYIPKDTEIKVTVVDGNRIVVKKKS
jgi:membrane-bound ClpP family serine protease